MLGLQPAAAARCSRKRLIQTTSQIIRQKKCPKLTEFFPQVSLKSRGDLGVKSLGPTGFPELVHFAEESQVVPSYAVPPMTGMNQVSTLPPFTPTTKVRILISADVYGSHTLIDIP